MKTHVSLTKQICQEITALQEGIHRDRRENDQIRAFSAEMRDNARKMREKAIQARVRAQEVLTTSLRNFSKSSAAYRSN
jgi:hypothetical protein